MKKILLLILLLWTVEATASTTYNIRGTEYKTDTLFHAMIGPGTSQTTLFMKSDAGRQMYVYYSIIDMTNPLITLRTVMGEDRTHGRETVSSMSQRKSKNGARYFLGVNGDFFYTSGTSKRGESKVGTPLGPCIVDGEIFRGYSTNWYTQFAIEKDKSTYIGHSAFNGTVTNPSGARVNFGGVNCDAINNKITIYNPYYFAGTDQSGTCSEVQVCLAESETFAIDHPFHVIVMDSASTKGDADIPANGYVLHGQGTTYDFVKNLQPGDTLTIDLHISIDGKEIKPVQMISSFPNSLREGIVTDTEWMLGEFGTEQPVTAMAFGEGGKKIYFLTIDGRSPKSSGARTTEIADLLRQLGATDALSFDSGGSSTFYTSALGIRNVPSDGIERPDGNGIFVVSSSPDDSIVSSIAFVDWVVKIPKYGLYRPKFFGYNKYGMLIDTNLKGVTITAPQQLGHVKEDGLTFIGDGAGCDSITAHFGQVTAKVPAVILGNDSTISLVNDSIINDAYRDYIIDVQNVYDGVSMKIDPSVLSWTTENNDIVSIDATRGSLRGTTNGTATVIGSIGSVVDTLKVIVEKPTAHIMAVEPNLDISSWKISQVGGTNGVATAQGSGFNYTYTGASGRAPKIVFTKKTRLWSLPDTLRLRVNLGKAPLKNIVFGVRANAGSIIYTNITPDTVIANQELTLDLPISRIIDQNDMSKYPLWLESVQINMNNSTVGAQYEMKFSGLKAIYNVIDETLHGDVNEDGAINVSDVTELINAILFNKAGTIYDIDENGVINVSDATTLINIILQP